MSLHQRTCQRVYFNKRINNLRRKVHDSGKSDGKEIDQYVVIAKQIFLHKIISNFWNLEK